MADSHSTEERWKPIPGYEGRYEVSDHGRVRSQRGLMALHRRTKPNKPKWMYLYASLLKNGKTFDARVNRLVLLAFIGPCPVGCISTHLDGDSLNNHLSNLAWRTHRENQRDRGRHGTMRGRMLTDEQEQEIVRRHRDGETQANLGRALGIPSKRIWKVVNLARLRAAPRSPEP